MKIPYVRLTPKQVTILRIIQEIQESKGSEGFCSRRELRDNLEAQLKTLTYNDEPLLIELVKVKYLRPVFDTWGHQVVSGYVIHEECPFDFLLA